MHRIHCSSSSRSQFNSTSMQHQLFSYHIQLIYGDYILFKESSEVLIENRHQKFETLHKNPILTFARFNMDEIASAAFFIVVSSILSNKIRCSRRLYSKIRGFFHLSQKVLLYSLIVSR